MRAEAAFGVIATQNNAVAASAMNLRMMFSSSCVWAAREQIDERRCRALALAHVLFGKPVSVQDQVRDRPFAGHALRLARSKQVRSGASNLQMGQILTAMSDLRSRV